MKAAREAGLDVNAGHDLSLDNLEVFLKACREVSEVSIGHALTAEALQFGFAETVRRYEEILDRRRRVRRLKGGAGHDRSTEAGSRLRRR